VAGVTGHAPSTCTDHVVERRWAVVLARYIREFDGLSIRQIADRLGRSPATVKAYFYDPTGEKAIGHRAHLCAQSPVIRRNIRGSDVARGDRQNDRFAGISCWRELGARVIRVGEVPGSNPGAPTQKTQQTLGFLLGGPASRSGGDWAQTLDGAGLAKPEGAEGGFEQGFWKVDLTGSCGAVHGCAPGFVPDVRPNELVWRSDEPVPVPSFAGGVGRATGPIGG
jgi:hypothetical protein